MNKYERSAGERWADKVNSWVVNLVFLIHIIIQLVRSPDPIPMSAKDTKPTLLVTLSGLAGPRKFWSGFVRHLVGTLPPETLSEWSWMAQGNVEAAEVPMHREVREKTWPAVLRHCERFGSEARVVLTGHSLGSVDALWIACEIRERFGGRVPVLLLSVAGAFGTARAPVLYSLGVHRTVVESIGTRSAPFLRELLGRCRTLPFHPRSRSLFVMRLRRRLHPAAAAIARVRFSNRLQEFVARLHARLRPLTRHHGVLRTPRPRGPEVLVKHI